MDFKPPRMAGGTIIPNGVKEQWLQETKAEAERKKQRRHDFLIATYGIVGGIASGALSSLIVLWLRGVL